MNPLVLGCDPEVFLKSGTTGQFISSIGRIGGTKDCPMPIDDDGNAVQEDNVAVEFNTPPCKSAGEFIKHIRKNLAYVEERAASMDLQVAIVPSAVFSDDELAHPQAQEFGCEPDYDAWKGGRRNPRPFAENQNLRSAGGHIHIQIDDPKIDIIEVIKAMDVFVALPLMDYDDDKERRELYGKPGAFRPKPYGVEYRTPSNVWVSSDDLIRLVWEQTEKAVRFVSEGNTISDEHGPEIQHALMKSDQDAAHRLMELYGVFH